MIGSIVVGTDGSETAEQAVREAIGLAAALGARLDVVSAFQPGSTHRPRSAASRAPDDAEWVLNERQEVDATLEAARGMAAAKGVEHVRTYARQGDPADAILDVAEEASSDLVVIGNKGMTGAKRFLLGSVPNKVSHHAPCSVLIVRTT